jgi:tripartite ATP-independent transporter DctP family solute receptor
MKRFNTLMFIVTMALLTILGAENTEASKKNASIVLKCGTIQSPADLVYQGYEAAVKYINEKGDGELEIQLFHSGQLGGQDTMSQDVQQGQYDIGQSSPAILSSFYPPIGVLSAPYIFRDSDHMMSVLNGDIGKELYSKVEENADIKIISTWYYGTRHLTSNIRGTTPKELRSVKMRIYNAPIAYEFAAALGTRATPIAFNELYLALKTGTVDAQENPLTVIHGRKFYEVQNYLILTGHVVEPYEIIMNKKVWSSLPQHLKNLVVEGFAHGGEVFYKMMMKQEGSLIESLDNLGMTIVKPADMTPFYENAKKIFERYEDKWDPSLVQAIRETK